MHARVKVRGVMWVDGQIVVSSYTNGAGETRTTLPGGRVRERESVIAALQREFSEEVGIDVNVGELVAVAEVKSAVNHHDLELIFEVAPVGEIDESALDLVDPATTEQTVLPPVLPHLTQLHQTPPQGVWLGNVFDQKLRAQLGTH